MNAVVEKPLFQVSAPPSLPSFLEQGVATERALARVAETERMCQCAHQLYEKALGDRAAQVAWALDQVLREWEHQIAEPFEKVVAAAHWHAAQGCASFLPEEEEDQLRFFASEVRRCRRERTPYAPTPRECAVMEELRTRYSRAFAARVRYPHARRDRDGHCDDEGEPDYGLVVIAGQACVKNDERGMRN